MGELEYLVSYGRVGDFGRFRSVPSVTFRRGDQVVVRSEHGEELGVVLCPATPGHGHFLSRTAQGELLRLAGAEDERIVELRRAEEQHIFEHARRMVRELKLPLEVLDIEVTLDGKQAIVHHLRRDECDYRSLVSDLSRGHDVLVVMQNLALPAELVESEHEGQGCGKPDCGQGNGGCTSCGTGGCGSCSQGTRKEDVADFLSGLRQQMDPRMRTPLL